MNRIFYPSLLILFILQGLGFSLAAHKPLWTDEIYTQTVALRQSYKNILLGIKIPEGNIAPFFYLQQKLFCDIFHFKTPQTWIDQHWQYVYPAANTFLRILPIFWMSSFFLLLFIYFTNRFNVFFGLWGLLTALTSPILWLYWAEARPYGLWVLLTGIQMILFLEVLEKGTRDPRKWLGLSLTHILLSLTCVLSFFQIAAVSLMLLFKERRWQRYLFLLAVPLLLIYYYRPHGPAHDVIFIIGVRDMFYGAATGVRPYILLLYPVLCAAYFLQSNNKLPNKIINNGTVAAVWPFFVSVILIVSAVIVFLTYLQQHATGQGQYVVTRHIIFLSPINVIGTTYLAGLVWQSVEVFWLRLLILLIIGGFLLWHINNLMGSIYQLMVYDPFSQ